MMLKFLFIFVFYSTIQSNSLTQERELADNPMTASLIKGLSNKNICKQALVESYNLTPYVTPRALNMWICPILTTSCCSVYDQFQMFQQWNNEIK